MSPFFMPHGHCYFWNPWLIGMNVLGGMGTFLSYMSIPFVVWYVASKRKEAQARSIALMFVSFILACGIGHFVDVITIKYPIYWVAGVVHLATGVISVKVAISLWMLKDDLVKAPSFDEMKALQERLDIQTEKNQIFFVGNTRFRRELGLDTLESLAEKNEKKTESIVLATLRNVSKLTISSGDFAYRSEAFNLTEMLKNQCLKRGVFLDSSAPEVSFIGAKDEVKMALRALAQNAHDYNTGKKKSPTATLSANEDLITIVLTNEGKLPDKPQEIIKAAWFSTSIKKEGMGLAVAEGCAIRHGGTLDIFEKNNIVNVLFTLKKGV